MTFWTITFFILLFGLSELEPLLKNLQIYFGQSKAILGLRRAANHLKHLQEMLESGVVPDREAWQRVREFPAPWGKILDDSLQELRTQGAAILPTLQRMQKTLEEQTELIQLGKVKSSQAMGQAWIGMMLVPGFGSLLVLMLPEIKAHLSLFLGLILFSSFLGSLAFLWILSMVDQARFGGIQPENRKWLVSVNVSLERLLALISTGLPPDLAWKKTIEELALTDLALAREWKSQVWDQDFSLSIPTENEAERMVLKLGVEVRRSIQSALLEGRACLDRIEAIHRAFLLDLRMIVGRDLECLPNRCLKPLFILVLPSVMIILVGGLYLTLKPYL